MQSRRNKYLRQHREHGWFLEKIHNVENSIGALQQEVAEFETLKASKFWRENSESSAGYIKRTITQREVQRSIPDLRHPELAHPLCQTNSEKMRVVESFYGDLYHEEDIVQESTNFLLDSISDTQLDENDSTFLMQEITIEEIIDSSQRSPNCSSPGPDGLPYEILSVILHHPLLEI